MIPSTAFEAVCAWDNKSECNDVVQIDVMRSSVIDWYVNNEIPYNSRLDCAERGAKVFLVGGKTSLRDGEASVDGFHFLLCSSAVAKPKMGSANILHLF